MNVETPFPKTSSLPQIDKFFNKKGEFMTEYSLFRKLCHLLLIFLQKNSLIRWCPEQMSNGRLLSGVQCSKCFYFDILLSLQQVYWDYVSEKVLVLEYLPGIETYPYVSCIH
jgi:hypothetical protein